MQLLRVILPRGKGSKFMEVLKNYGAHVITCCYGFGSASDSISTKLHIDKIKKEIVMAILDDDKVTEILEKLDERINKNNTSIVFTSPLYCKGEEDLIDNNYTALYIIVDRQQGHKAIQIAQENGAKGATLVHGRGTGEKVKTILMNMSIEPEKDIVIMLVRKEHVDKIKSAIYEQMNLEKENKGIIFSLPVMEVRGLVDQD